MDCSEIRQWIFRSLEGELSPGEEERLTAHLRECPACDWEMKLLSLPRRLARAVPAFEPSPYFYQRLRAQLGSVEESITIWQILIALSRQLVPALAVITLALLSIFSYQQLRSSTADVHSWRPASPRGNSRPGGDHRRECAQGHRRRGTGWRARERNRLLEEVSISR